MKTAEIFSNRFMRRARKSRLKKSRSIGRKFQLEALEPRLLLSGDPFTFAAVPNGVPDTYTLRYDNGMDQFYVLDAGSNEVARSGTDTTTIDITGENDQNDTLIVDFGNNFSSFVDISFDGGGGTATDVLEITGTSTFDTVTYAADASDSASGSIQFDKAGSGLSISYSGLEPVVDSTAAADRVFNATANGESIRITDTGGADGLSLIEDDGTSAFEAITFANPTGKLTVNALGGDDTVIIDGLDAGFSAELEVNGGTGADIYDFAAGWNTDVTIVDAGGGTGDFSALGPTLHFEVDGADPLEIRAVNASGMLVATATVPANFESGLDAFDPDNGKTHLDSALLELENVLEGLGGTGLLGQSLPFLGDSSGTFGQSIGSLLDLADVLDVYVVDKVANGVDSDTTLDAIVAELDVTDNTGTLTGSVGVVGTLLDGGGLKLDVTLDVERQSSVKLGLFRGELGNLLSVPDGTFVDANLTTRVTWRFDVGIDAAGNFVGHFDLDDIVVTASIAENLDVDAAAGFLGVNATGPLALNLAVTVDTDGLDDDGMGSTSLTDLQSVMAANLPQADTEVSSELTLALAATPLPGVSGAIATGTVAYADTNVFDAVGPVVTRTNFGDIDNFFNTDATAVRQMLQQFGTFLNVLGLKALDHSPVVLTAGTTFGDVLDLQRVFQEDLLALIELPPHTAATPLTDITDGDPLGTSDGGDPEIAVTLRDKRSFTVNLDSGSPVTLGDIMTLIADAASSAGIAVTDFEVRTGANGALSLVDYTSAAADTDRFTVMPLQDGSGEDYAAAGNLGLAAAAAERDVNDDGATEFVIDVAPNPGPNFATLQQMNTLAGSGANTSITNVSYDASDPAAPKVGFTIGIVRTFANAEDTLALLNLGPLTDLVTASTVDVLHPTVTLNLPFELLLEPVGFSGAGLSASTLLSDLNAGAGVPVIEGADDIRVHLADGTAFTVDLDVGLAARTLASFGVSDGAGDELSITLNDGTSFSVDLSANVASTGSPPANLGELAELIQAEADAVTADADDFEARVDRARGALSLIDRTSGALTFAVTGSAAAALGLDGGAITRTVGGEDIDVIEDPAVFSVTVGDLIARIESAGLGAGLTLPNPADPSAFWDFDVQIDGDGIVLVDRTTRATVIAGAASAGAAANEIRDTGAGFSPDSLVGRTVEITGGAGAGQSLRIVANTVDTITVEADWETVPLAGDGYRIAADLFVVALNDSGARVALGLAGFEGEQEALADTPLFDGSEGVFVGTNGAGSDDLRVQLSGAGGSSFDVDLDAGTPGGIGDIAGQIAQAALQAGVPATAFEVFVDAAGNISLVDRAAGGVVSEFSVINLNGSTAATDLGLDAGAIESDVDFDGVTEFVIELGSAGRVLGGGPLHGDTPSAHLWLLHDSGPQIAVDLGLDDAAGASRSGSGLYGPLAVDFTNLDVGLNVSNGALAGTAHLDADIELETRTLRQLTEGLVDPFTLMVGGEVAFDGDFALTMDLSPQPSIGGVSGATSFNVDIDGIYDVLAGTETITPAYPGSSGVRTLLLAVEQLAVADVLDYLDTAGDYLFALQTQSPLAVRLPGLSASMGELLAFGDNFKARIAELRELELESLQGINAALGAADSPVLETLEGVLTAALSFDAGAATLQFDLDYALDPVAAELPVTLDLTKLGDDLNDAGDSRADLGLEKVAAIVDTEGASPLDVTASGDIDLQLGIDLSNASAPAPLLLGDIAAGSGTGASFGIRAVNDDELNFTALFGSLPVEITGGSFILDQDGDGGSTNAATYTVQLEHNIDLAPSFDATTAAAEPNTTVETAGRVDARFELAFPESVVPADAPFGVIPFIEVSVAHLNDPAAPNAPGPRGSTLITNLTGLAGAWPTFESIAANFSLSDTMDGFRLGIFDLFTRLDEALDTALFGLELPLVGTQLTEAADFILQVRDTVFDNLTLLSDVLTPEVVHQTLFEALGPGGLGWLQDDQSANNPDTEVNIHDIDLVLETVTPTGSRELVVGAEYQMHLAVAPQLLEFPVDLDLLLPGLGLDIDAPARVLFGFEFPLSLGISIADGVYVDVSAVDELEISLDVALPAAAFLMTGNPRLTFANTGSPSPTITRDRGSWLLDGFRVGHIIEVAGSDPNTEINDGEYVISGIDPAGKVLALDPVLGNGGSVAAQGPEDGFSIVVTKVSMTGAPALSFHSSAQQITRDAGSWLDDGFRVGDAISISGAGPNNGDFAITAIDRTGQVLTVGTSLSDAAGVPGKVVLTDEPQGFDARMGVLPYRVWDATPGESELTGTFLIDLLDPAVIGGNQRLSLNDLITASPFPVAPPTGFTTAPLSNLLAVAERAGEELTLNPISLRLETNLPPGAAFPPYRMNLDITNWDWSVTASLISEDSTPAIGFNDVQFELVGFVRDFLGPVVTRLNVAYEPLDGLLDFLNSEAFPILTVFFGRGSYVSTSSTFGGQADIGNFAGASLALRALADGGQPFERDAISEFLIDQITDEEFDDVTLQPIMQLTGEAWIDIGAFTVDGAVARGMEGTLFDDAAHPERVLGDIDDADSIFGQIAAIARDETAPARAAATSFLVTQLLPGSLPFEGVISAVAATAVGGGIDPIELPILERSFGLLVGDTAFGPGAEHSHLLNYRTPELFVALYQDIPLGACSPLVTMGNAAKKALCPLVEGFWTPFLSVSFEARADFEVGFDTTGLERYAITGNPDDILDGFYFDDNEGIEPTPAVIGNEAAGLGAASFVSDEAQSRILGGVGFGVFVGKSIPPLFEFKAGAEAVFFTGRDLNFHDPSGDGRVRASEFDVLTGFEQDFSSGAFDGTGADAYVDGGRFEVRFDVFARIKAFVTFLDLRINIITLGFTIPVDTPDFRAPDLATQDGTVLWLNIGAGTGADATHNASARGFRTGVTDETLYIGYDADADRIVVSGFGPQSESFAAEGITLIKGLAGSGADRIVVTDAVMQPVHLEGGPGADMLIGGGGADVLRGDGGNDWIEGGPGNDDIEGGALADLLFGGLGDDHIGGGGGNDLIFGQRGDDVIMGGDADDAIHGGPGDDDINGGDGDDIVLGWLGRDTLRGGPGRDTVEGGKGADIIDGDDSTTPDSPTDDDDLLFGGFGNDTIDGGPGEDVIFGEQHNDLLLGGPGNDILDGGGASDTVLGGDGDDLIKSRAGNDILDGNAGDDTFKVFFQGGKAGSLIKILESGPAADTDVFEANGTPLADHFLLRANASGSNAFVAMLNDPDHDIADPEYDPTVERINYTGLERIVVNGFAGDDRFAVDDTAAEITLNGGMGDDSFQIGQLFRSQRNEEDANVSVGDVFATIETTRGFLSNGISKPMTANGGLGNDRFVVFHNRAVLSLNGDEGDDEFDVRAFALVGSQEPQRERTDITGGAGADLLQHAVNAPVNINGGDGSDTVIVTGTEFADDFVITEKGVFGAGLTVNFVNIESLRVDGAEGNDRFFVQSTSETFLTELFGGLGEDTFNMSGDTPPVTSNDLVGHSGIITNDVTFSDDLRYENLTLYGVSANVADNDEPFVVVRESGGSTIVTEDDPFDSYEVVLSRAPELGFSVLVMALAPLPTPDQRERGGRAFRLSSPGPGAEEKADGSVVTLRFTADNWYVPQLVEVRADGASQMDTGRLFTRPELGESIVFDYDDDAFEGVRSAVINHLVVSAAATVEGNPVSVEASPTITIETDRPFYEFLGEEIRVTLTDGTVQERRISDARLVGGNMQLTVDRSWLAGPSLPNISNVDEILVEGTPYPFVAAANPTFTIADPLDPANPYLDNVDDLLGREVTITDGPGAGESRFITAVDSEGIFHLSDSANGLYAPNSLAFSFDLTQGNHAVIPTSDTVLKIIAQGDFNNSLEKLEVDVEGVATQSLFGGGAGRFYSPLAAEIPLTQSQLEGILSDGQLDLMFTPSESANLLVNVDNYDPAYAATRGPASLSFELEFTADINDGAVFNPGVVDNLRLRLTLDRGWPATGVPDASSSYQIRIDDALVGRVSAFDEMPAGLPADPNFPPSLDQRSTFTDLTRDFSVASLGPEGLRGAVLQIVGGPGAGQQRLVLGTLPSNPHTLILNGPWRTDPIGGESLYRIERYDGLAIPSVSVQINDNDRAGLIVDETRGYENGLSADYDTITAVIEGGDGDHLGERDVVQVRLARAPVDDVTVDLVYDGTQLNLELLDGSAITNNELVFTPANWNVFQQVVVSAPADLEREGFHTSLIEFEIEDLAGGGINNLDDADRISNATDDFDIAADEPVEFVGLRQQPVGNVVVTYNGQTLVNGTSGGTTGAPVYEVVSNKILFRAGGELTTVAGNDLHVTYDYIAPGFANAFTAPVLVRINDADAPTVLVRETGGSTDVIEVNKAASPALPNEIPDSFGTEASPWEDVYELVLTGEPDNGAGGGTVQVTVTPEITKTTRTGGVRTDDYQVEIFNIDGLPSGRVDVDPSDSRNLIVTFDTTNWDEPVRIGVRAIDDTKVDGGDTKVFASGPNTVSRILGPVVVDGAGGAGSLVGISPPAMLPGETNVKEKTGDVDSVAGFEVTVSLDADQLAKLDLEPDLSDVGELAGKTLEVTGVTTGNPNDPLVGQFRLISAASTGVGANQVVLTLDERFGVGGDTVGSVTSTEVEITLSREQRLKLGIGDAGDLAGRTLEVTGAAGTTIGQGEITAAADQPGGETILTVDTDFTGLPVSGYFISAGPLIQSYAITEESLNFFVNEADLVDFMFVHDEDSPADSTGYLTATRLWGLNMGPDITIGSRLRAGGITYGNLEVLDIDLGSGNNDFHVLGTHTRPDDPSTPADEFFQTWTFLNTGNDIFWPPTARQGDSVSVALNDADVPAMSGHATGGANPTEIRFATLEDSTAPFGAADSLAGYRVTINPGTGNEQVRTVLGNDSDTLFLDGVWGEIPDAGDPYEIINPADGRIAIDTQGGDDTVDAMGSTSPSGSASTLGIVVFGGLGNDTIDGGLGEDILFGDRGRVDYFDEVTGAIVTRLGTAPEPILGTVTSAVSGTLDTLVDSGATFPYPNEDNDNDLGLVGLYVDVNDGSGFLQTPRLITDNTANSLTLATPFDDSLDLPGADPGNPSRYRISTYPEDQTDGVAHRPNIIVSVDPELGGNDIIHSGDGSDIVIGGAGADEIVATVTDDGGDDEVVLGDSGQIAAAAGNNGDNGAGDYAITLGRVMTTAAAVGGDDRITTGGGNDIVLAGMSGSDLVHRDVVDAGDGNNVGIGDSGYVVFAGAFGDALLTDSATGEIVITVESDPTDALSDDVFTYRYMPDSDPTDIDRIETTAAAAGGADEITTGSGNDFVLGGTAGDVVYAGGGNDLVFGDHGRIQGDVDAALLPLVTLAPAFTFTATDTQDSHGGGDDLIFGESGEDILLGQQGSDRIDGGAQDDDIIGGHNVAGGRDAGDFLDGGPGNDVIAGDNASVLRRGDNLSPRMRTLQGTVIYGEDGEALVSPLGLLDNPTGAQSRALEIFDHSDAPAAGTYGNDSIAGGAQDDVIFGQLGDDIIQGDGSHDFEADGTIGLQVGAERQADGTLSVLPSVEDWEGPGSDGDDYIEGNGGGDVIFGNLGQDDIVGGSSSLFGLTDPSQRPDGEDVIYGGAGTRIARNDLGNGSEEGHARDADTILGDNGNILRLVGTNGAPTTPFSFLTFNYDDYTGGLPAAEQLRIIPRAIELLDYTPGGGPSDTGGADLAHGESGDDVIHGMTGNDVLFGDGQDDDLYGGVGFDRIYGGTGEDGIVGDDGKIFTSRNGQTEPLNGLTAPNEETSINTPGPWTGAVVYIADRLHKWVDLAPFDAGGSDIIYGGLGDDFIHAGAGDDAVSGAEALAEFYNDAPNTNGDPLGYDPLTRKLAAYNAEDPRTKIAGFLLNFEATDAGGGKIEDGKDRIFGDLGNDWLVGGTQNDRLFGGMGDDLLNADDNHDNGSAPGLNDMPDSAEFADADFVFGGAGLDVMIANTGADRLFDWSGEFNSYFVPFGPFGAPTVNRLPTPQIQQFILDLGAASGADPSISEPEGELGLVTSGDPEWGDQHGAPRDPQPGNIGGVARDTQGGPENDSATATVQSTDSGNNNGNRNGGGKKLIAAASSSEDLGTSPSVTYEGLEPVIEEAIARWADTAVLGADALDLLNGVTFEIADLDGLQLGQTAGNAVVIDIDAAGYGWFIDPTPGDDAEFAIASEGDELLAAPGSESYGDVDLLTVVMHELGHVLGLEHIEAGEGHELMGPTLPVGVRRVNGSGEVSSEAVRQAVPISVEEERFEDGSGADSGSVLVYDDASGGFHVAKRGIGRFPSIGDVLDFAGFEALPEREGSFRRDNEKAQNRLPLREEDWGRPLGLYATEDAKKAARKRGGEVLLDWSAPRPPTGSLERGVAPGYHKCPSFPTTLLNLASWRKF